MVKYNIIIAKRTFEMLNKHITFPAKVSTKSAHFLRKTFFETVKSLDLNPERYALWQTDFELSDPYRSILIKKRYLIIFYIEDNNVFVDYLLDCRMDNSKLF